MILFFFFFFFPSLNSLAAKGGKKSRAALLNEVALAGVQGKNRGGRLDRLGPESRRPASRAGAAHSGVIPGNCQQVLLKVRWQAEKGQGLGAGSLRGGGGGWGGRK